MINNSNAYATYKSEGEIVLVCNDTRQRDWPSAQIDETQKYFDLISLEMLATPGFQELLQTNKKIYIRTHH
jgi:hypothetical protein